MDITVRAAGHAELTAVGELTAAAYRVDGLLDAGDPYLDTLADAARRAAGAELLVASEPKGPPLGTVTFAVAGGAFAEVAQPGEAEFRMLAVAAEARGRGVGETLVRACVERARHLGLRRVVLSTQPAMRTAHRLYERLGFARDPALDWRPVPEVPLWGFALPLPHPEIRHNI